MASIITQIITGTHIAVVKRWQTLGLVEQRISTIEISLHIIYNGKNILNNGTQEELLIIPLCDGL